MGEVKRLELWWQLYFTSRPVPDAENFKPLDGFLLNRLYIINVRYWNMHWYLQRSASCTWNGLCQQAAGRLPYCNPLPKDMYSPLTPNDPYRIRTAPLTSQRCILYIYSTNIGTEYFKHGIYSPFFFPLQNAVCFIILTYLVPVLFTFYIFIQQI